MALKVFFQSSICADFAHMQDSERIRGLAYSLTQRVNPGVSGLSGGICLSAKRMAVFLSTSSTVLTNGTVWIPLDFDPVVRYSLVLFPFFFRLCFLLFAMLV